MRIFWKNGYEGASLPELTKAMGINRPSMYAAFGNKQELFKRAVDRYTSGTAGYSADALAEPTARGVAERLLYGAIDISTDPRNPSGCLLVQGALACGNDAACVRDHLTKCRQAGMEALAHRFQRAVEEGDLPKNADPGHLARFITTILFGMSIQVASGATKKDLVKIAETAMEAWPK